MLMLLPMTPQFLYPESDQIKGFGYIYRNDYEKLGLSKEIVEEFVKENLPTHKIERVVGDGNCMLTL